MIERKVKIIFARCLKFNNLRFSDVIYDDTTPKQVQMTSRTVECLSVCANFTPHFTKTLKVWRVAPDRFGISTLELTQNRYMSQNMVQCSVA